MIPDMTYLPKTTTAISSIEILATQMHGVFGPLSGKVEEEL